MFMQPQEMVPGKLDEGFSRPVESIMRCEDFKSNFARRLSNRYISRSPASTPKQDTALKLRPNRELSENAPERIEPSSQLSKCITESNNGAVKPPDKSRVKTSDIRSIEVGALNMEVETLRWQLAQTEANRQMHIALLKQIVTFLSRVKEHIEGQKPDSETIKDMMTTRLSPRSFNLADLPRSRSVFHVNKNLEYSLSPTKRISTRKISKSISNVNGYRDCSGVWSQSKLSLASETESAQKITEEMSRLITLANTVLSTKLPDLACTCNDVNEINTLKLNDYVDTEERGQQNESIASLHSIGEDATNAFIMNTICDSEDTLDVLSNKFAEANDRSIHDFMVSPSPLTCGLENDFADVKINENDFKSSPSANTMNSSSGKTHRLIGKRNEYSHAVNFIEDESGFSSMSSFQEIGIPIISIIPPSPCKEIGYMGDITDILDEPGKWKNDAMDIDKQAVKVFWV